METACTDTFDPACETPIRLATATKLPELQRDGRSLDVSTIFRWAQRGVRGVKLETVTIGGAKCTSREAVRRFIEQLSGRELPRSGNEQRAAAALARMRSKGFRA